jgi:peptidoglycan glycosyltransferase
MSGTSVWLLRLFALLALLGVFASLSLAQTTDRARGSSPRTASADRTEATPAPARPRRPSALEGFDPLSHRVEDGTLLSDLPDGSTAILSLDEGLQAAMESVFERYEVPYAGLVAIEPSTGRVLAYVSHSSAEPGVTDLARDAGPPAASVFKIITGAALLEAGVSPDERVCYRGGSGSISLAHLEAHPGDPSCATLSEAMGRSVNPVFARLADQHLNAATLTRYASAFGFGESLPFDAPTRVSSFDVPDDRLERARMAAGFWHTHMSPLHGALIAATLANGGRMPRASMVDQVIDGRGRVVYENEPTTFRSVVGRGTAELLTDMMQRTVREGTSRRAFHDDRGRPFLPGIEVAGKTGTLSSERPYRGYTWWVGFAPADAPTIALATVVINRPEWRIKASDAARFALEHWLVTRPARASE